MSKKTKSISYWWFVAFGVVMGLVSFFLYKNYLQQPALPEFKNVEESARDSMIIEGETATPSATPK